MKRDETQLGFPASLDEGNAASIRIERAVSELRFGRPAIFQDGTASILLVALDAVDGDQFDRFHLAARNGGGLFLTGPRAESLGLGSHSQGIAIPLVDLDFEKASKLAYGLGAPTPAVWKPAASILLAASQLMKIAQLLPAMMFLEMGERGVSRTDYPIVHRHDLSAARVGTGSRFRCIARSNVPLQGLGDCEFLVFRGGLAQRDQLAISIGKPDLSGPVPVRIHSSCITGDLLGSLKCDCGDQLKNAMAALANLGGGILIYLDQEGRGTGLAAKLRAYSYQTLGLDTIEADAQLGFGPDERDYAAAVDILSELGISNVNLLTNNPSKARYLDRHGLRVEKCTSIIGVLRAENSKYLKIKATKAGHIFPEGYLSCSDIGVHSCTYEREESATH